MKRPRTTRRKKREPPIATPHLPRRKKKNNPVMDVWGFCVSDSTMSYGGSMRSGYYRDYEQFPYGTLETTTSSYAVKDCYSRVQGNGAPRIAINDS